MTLTIEYRHGAWWLVTLDSTGSQSRTLALFTNEDAAYAFKAVMAHSLRFAKAAGEIGL